MREGSFSRAALALKLGQPAISSRIQGLEAAPGGPLSPATSNRVALLRAEAEGLGLGPRGSDLR